MTTKIKGAGSASVPCRQNLDIRPTDGRPAAFLNLHGPLPSQYLFDLEGENG